MLRVSQPAAVKIADRLAAGTSAVLFGVAYDTIVATQVIRSARIFASRPAERPPAARD